MAPQPPPPLERRLKGGLGAALGPMPGFEIPEHDGQPGQRMVARVLPARLPGSERPEIQSIHRIACFGLPIAGVGEKLDPQVSGGIAQGAANPRWILVDRHVGRQDTYRLGAPPFPLRPEPFTRCDSERGCLSVSES